MKLDGTQDAGSVLPLFGYANTFGTVAASRSQVRFPVEPI